MLGIYLPEVVCKYRINFLQLCFNCCAGSIHRRLAGLSSLLFLKVQAQLNF